jgi:hypothetical protein
VLLPALATILRLASSVLCATRIRHIELGGLGAALQLRASCTMPPAACALRAHIYAADSPWAVAVPRCVGCVALAVVTLARAAHSTSARATGFLPASETTQTSH